MPIGQLLFLSWRGLLQSRLITVLLCAAVAGGVAFQIPNAANLRGYERAIIENGLVVGNGDVRVRPRQGARFDNADAVAATLATRDGVVAAVPVLALAGAIGKTSNFKGALVVGVDSAASRLPFQIAGGTAVPMGDVYSIVVGTALARRLDVVVGDEVQLRVVLGTAWESLDPDNDVGRYTMKVAGLAAGSFLSPESIIVDRSFLARELGLPGTASQIVVHLTDHFAARSVAAQIERELPDITAVAWNDDSPFLSSALHASTAIGLVSRAMVWLAVLIPVWALLYVHVLHRQRQIGVMSAIGLSRSDLFAIHLVQAAIVGVVGAVIGCVVGFALVSWFSSNPIFRAGAFEVLPVVSAATFVVPALFVLATTLLAGVVPAWRAARLDPARILRGTA
jgi:ABC-type lipoprotein release transport system permease subunit